MKIANQNLLLLGAPALLAGAAGVGLCVVGNGLLRASQAAFPTIPAGGVGDVEGYAYIIQILGAGAGQLTGFFAVVAGLLLAGYGALVLLLGLAARAVYKTTPGRLLAYRVLIGADLLVLVLPVPALLASSFRDLLQGSLEVEPLVVVAALAALAALVIRNTYTGRANPPAAPEPIAPPDHTF